MIGVSITKKILLILSIRLIWNPIQKLMVLGRFPLFQLKDKLRTHASQKIIKDCNWITVTDRGCS